MSGEREGGGGGRDSTLMSERRVDLGVEETLAAGTQSPASPQARAPGGGGDVTSAERDYDALRAVDPDSYVFGRWFASGGMGRIAEVRDRRLGRVVALKELIHPDPTMVERFKREVYITARLQHPAIVPVHEAGLWPGGEPFLVMKRVEGESLKDVLARVETFAERLELLSRVITIADALAYAHERQVIHRDLKPSNVLVGEHGETVVIDWGLAVTLGDPVDPGGDAAPPISGSGSGVTAVGSVVGTPAYMAPEQARGEPADTRSDVYAIGAILYEVLGGAAPYSGPDATSIIERVLEHDPEPLPALVPEVPGDLATIVATAMARDPGDRYPSAVELADDLRRFTTGRLVAAHRYSRAALVARWIRRHRAAVLVALVGIVALAVLSVVSVARVIDERDQATAARAEAQARADRLTVSQARSLATGDPISALRLLATLPAESPEWSAGRLVAADAVAGGVPEIFAAPLSSADRHELSPDGTGVYLATGREVVRHDLESGRARSIGSHTSRIVELELGRDGELIVAGGSDGAISVWSARGELVARLTGHDGWVEEAYVSPSGAHLVTSGLDRTTRIWDLAAARQIAAIPRFLAAVSFAADGRRMAALDLGRGVDQQVAIYDLFTGAEQLIDGARGSFGALSMSPDGTEVATGDRAGAIRLWTVATGAVRDVGTQDGIGDVDFAPGGARIASAGSSGTVTVWSAAGSESPWVYAGAGGAARLEFSSDGEHLLVRGGDGDIHVLTPARRRGRRLAGAISDPVLAGDAVVAVSGRDRVGRWPMSGGGERELESSARVRGLAFSPDGSALVGPGTGWTLQVWDTASGEHRDLHGHRAQVVAAAVSPNGALAASVGDKKRVRLWHLVSGSSVELRGRVAGPPIFSPDGAWLAAPGDDLTVKLWNLESGAVRSLAGHRGWVVSCEFSPDGRALASSDSAGEIRLWDRASGESAVLGAHEARPTELVFAPSGERVVVGDEAGELRWWSTSGAPVIAAGGHRSWLTALAVAADGTIASGGADGVVRLWDDRGAELRALEGHVGAVWSLDFSADNQSLVSGGTDGDARIWDRASGGYRILSGHRQPVRVVRFSPAGDRLATSSADATIRVWRDDLPREPAALRRWIDEILQRSR
jgi:WD40 repeat protein